MKRNHKNSIIFVAVSSVLLAAACIALALGGIHLYVKSQSFVGPIVMTLILIVLCFAGILAIHEAHSRIFYDMRESCMSCFAQFEKKEIKKQTEHTPTGVFILHKCPSCDSTLER